MSRYNWRRWSTKQWLRLLFSALVVIPGLGFLLVSTALMAYIFWPKSYSQTALPGIEPGAEHLVLIVHGVRDTTASWSGPLKTTLENGSQSRDGSLQVIALDWNPYSRETLRCSVDGMRIGQRLGDTWGDSARLQSLHLIGHSCGAFVVLGLCEAISKKRADIRLQSTYLDPVSIYGGLLWNYGIDHFGQCADFSEAYIDRDDGVPGSNQLLPNAHTFDVTRARGKMDYTASPHVWPTFYYHQLVKAGRYPNLQDDDKLWQRYPRGQIEEVDSLPWQH